MHINGSKELVKPMLDYEKLLQQLPHAICLLDPATLAIVNINHTGKVLLGNNQDTSSKNSDFWLKYLHPDDAPNVLAQLQQVSEQQDQTIEFRLGSIKRKFLWLQMHAQIFQTTDNSEPLILATLIDLSDTYNQMQTAQQNLVELVENSATVVYRCEPSDTFPATFISHNVTRQLGYQPEDFINNPNFWASNIHPDDREEIFNNLGQLFEHGFHSHEYRFQHSQGHYVWMHDELRLSYDANGEVKDIVGNWLDITQSKELELSKIAAEKKYQHAKKMQAIGTLAGGIAHEFNNLLGIIMGYTD
ncbi:MAG: PAS domain-containing protein, partial [Gammaproteobacteria bacterium]|nr:PAS domain-containing protein [Gammaproteobacteria bacterium]